MTTLKTHLLRGVALSISAFALVSVAHAQDVNMLRRTPAQRRPATFDVSGSYTGAINGQVVINGIGHPVAETVQVYQLGYGLIPLADLPIGSCVFASGMGTEDDGAVLVMIARPINEGLADATSPSPNIRVKDASAPR